MAVKFPVRHIVAVQGIGLKAATPPHHLAQAKLEGFTLITDNKKLQDYGISVLAG